MLPGCQGTHICKATLPKYKPIKSKHPGSANIRLSGPFTSPAVATIGLREQSRNMPGIEDNSHDGDPFHCVVI